MGTRKDNSAIAKLLRPLGFGIGFGAVTCLLALLIAAAIMTTGAIPASAVTPIAFVAASLAAFVGGFVAARCSRERGLLFGAGCGLLLFLLVTLIGIATLKEVQGTTMLLKAALTMGLGALGGIIGVNAKRR